VTARIDTRVRITSRPDKHDTLVEELNDGELSMLDDDVMTCAACGATATVREAQQAYTADRWVPVTPKRRKPKKVWDYAYITRLMHQPRARMITILYDDEDLGKAYPLEPKVAVIADVPLCRNLFLYDIVRLRREAKDTHEKASTILQRYYAQQCAIYYLPEPR
jgi:hypothetical protein